MKETIENLDFSTMTEDGANNLLTLFSIMIGLRPLQKIFWMNIMKIFLNFFGN
jgi:hypothetical protein